MFACRLVELCANDLLVAAAYKLGMRRRHVCFQREPKIAMFVWLFIVVKVEGRAVKYVGVNFTQSVADGDRLLHPITLIKKQTSN